jgi:serine phosphatase RsbU (regulator of sigma subunit)
METLQLEYSGAFNPAWIFRGDELFTLEPDKFAIGSFNHGEKLYTNKSFQLEKGDRIYLFSDGFQDQFGGPKGKKFMKKRFRELIHELQSEPLSHHLSKLESTLNEWQGKEEQVDDILVIGIEI